MSYTKLNLTSKDRVPLVRVDASRSMLIFNKHALSRCPQKAFTVYEDDEKKELVFDLNTESNNRDSLIIKKPEHKTSSPVHVNKPLARLLFEKYKEYFQENNQVVYCCFMLEEFNVEVPGEDKKKILYRLIPTKLTNIKLAEVYPHDLYD